MFGTDAIQNPVCFIKALARTFIFWTAAVGLQQRRTSSFISLTWWLRLKNILIAYAYVTVPLENRAVVLLIM